MGEYTEKNMLKNRKARKGIIDEGDQIKLKNKPGVGRNSQAV